MAAGRYLVFECESYPKAHLPMGDLAVLDMASRFCQLKPPHTADGLRGPSEGANSPPGSLLPRDVRQQRIAHCDEHGTLFLGQGG